MTALLLRVVLKSRKKEGNWLSRSQTQVFFCRLPLIHISVDGNSLNCDEIHKKTKIQKNSKQHVTVPALCCSSEQLL